MKENIFVIGATRKEGIKSEIVGATPNRLRAEDIANEVFQRNRIKKAFVVYISDGKQEDKLNVVYKVESICSHLNIQGHFNFDDPTNPLFICDNCKVDLTIFSLVRPLEVMLKQTERF